MSKIIREIKKKKQLFCFFPFVETTDDKSISAGPCAFHKSRNWLLLSVADEGWRHLAEQML